MNNIYIGQRYRKMGNAQSEENALDPEQLLAELNECRAELVRHSIDLVACRRTIVLADRQRAAGERQRLLLLDERNDLRDERDALREQVASLRAVAMSALGRERDQLRASAAGRRARDGVMPSRAPCQLNSLTCLRTTKNY